jgi:alpha-glucoside transport system substrate-binding protein
MSKRISLLLIAAFIVMLVAPVSAQDATIDCMGSEGATVSIMASWAGEEEETFKSILSPLLDGCNITLAYEGSRDMATILPTRVEGGAPPDIAVLANPGSLQIYADNLVALEEVGVNADNYVQGWKDLGTVNDVWVGLPVKTDIKSIVWYSPIAFEASGYAVPATWDELVALMDQMVADGGPAPLSMGFESGGATGWTATDFIQDILLRTQGLEYTNGLATGETAWTDAGVVEAWQTYLDWVNMYGAGGTDGALTTPFGDAILLPFQDPPGAWMVKQSGFAGSAFIQPNFEDYVYGEDFAFFPLPTPDGEPAPMQVGGDFMAVFNSTPAVQALVAYLSSADGASSWAAAGFDLTPNSAVDLMAYTNPISADKAAALSAAPDVSYDVGDLLPGGAGSAEFEAITAVVGGAPIETALQNVQDAVTQAMSS